MSIIDIVLGALLLFGLIRGLMKGLFVELASLVALLLGVWGAIHFSFYVAEFIQARTDWAEKTINIVAFGITFVVIVLAISLAGKALTKLADLASLGIINKLLGALFGVAKIGLILSVLIGVFEKLNNTLPFLSEDQIEDSVLYEPVRSFAPKVYPIIIKSEAEEPENDEVETT